MSATFRRNLYQTIAIAAALLFVYSSLLAKLGRDWWSDENYSHGLLIPFVIGYILWQERKQFRQAQKRPAIWFGALGVGFALLMLMAGTVGAELFGQRISLVVMLASVAIYFWGFSLLRLIAVPLFLLLLSIPIPQIIFNRIAFPLQLFASRCAVAAMSFFSIPVLRQGNVIELMPLGAINFSLSSSATADPQMARDKLKFVGHFSFWRALILVIAAVPIAILTN